MQGEHSPCQVASLDLFLAFAQPGHECIGEAALFVTVWLEAIHSNGVLGKVGHLTKETGRHPPVLASVPLHCLLRGQTPPELFLHAGWGDAAFGGQAHLPLEFSHRASRSQGVPAILCKSRECSLCAYCGL